MANAKVGPADFLLLRVVGQGAFGKVSSNAVSVIHLNVTCLLAVTVAHKTQLHSCKTQSVRAINQTYDSFVLVNHQS